MNSFQIMFCNSRVQSYSHNEKKMKPRTKKYKSRKKYDVSKQLKNSKLQKNHKHSKFKQIKTISDYLGPNRLTRHVGFLSKGKISDSISRIEKVMSKEVKARAKQDLQEVLKLSHSRKHNHKKNQITGFDNISFEAQSLQSIYESPQYLNHNSIFASNSWKDKLQKSVGVATVNSVLASVHEPQKNTPVKELQLIARKVLLNTIHPFIKQTNNQLFPDGTCVDKMRNKLRDIKNKFLKNTPIPFEKPSSVCIKSVITPNNFEISHTQSSVDDDFHLNPIFTGDVLDQADFTQIFPSANELTNESDYSVSDNDIVDLPDDLYLPETMSSQAQSSRSSVTLVPVSPMTSEEDSPVWKLRLSPAKFAPELDSTPTLYFRHKMF